MTAKLWSVNEVAEYLGMAEGTVYHLLSQRRLPCIRISSRCVRFDPRAIEAWAAERMENAQGPDSDRVAPTTMPVRRAHKNAG